MDSTVKAFQQQMLSLRAELASAGNISAETRDDFFAKLSSLEAALNTQANKVHSFSRPYLDEYQELYGKVDQRFTDSEIDVIKNLTCQLNADLANGVKDKVIAEKAALQAHIALLERDYRLLSADLQVVRSGRASVRMAEAFLNKQGVDTGMMMARRANCLLKLQEPVLEELEDEEREPEAMELFSIAYTLYRHRTRDALRQFNQLSSAQQERFRRHVATLGGNPADLLADTTISIQALVATAREVCAADDGNIYLSEVEIGEMFQEVLDLSHKAASGKFC